MAAGPGRLRQRGIMGRCGRVRTSGLHCHQYFYKKPLF
ncbi:hypothetical protein GWL_03560 [Herbaspirillum sp. GW103]|nr:hypothetical protein GWL_03560 [Herbaspirillum sp. GW103]